MTWIGSYDYEAKVKHDIHKVQQPFSMAHTPRYIHTHNPRLITHHSPRPIQWAAPLQEPMTTSDYTGSHAFFDMGLCHGPWAWTGCRWWRRCRPVGLASWPLWGAAGVARCPLSRYGPTSHLTHAIYGPYPQPPSPLTSRDTGRAWRSVHWRPLLSMPDPRSCLCVCSLRRARRSVPAGRRTPASSTMTTRPRSPSPSSYCPPRTRQTW